MFPCSGLKKLSQVLSSLCSAIAHLLFVPQYNEHRTHSKYTERQFLLNMILRKRLGSLLALQAITEIYEFKWEQNYNRFLLLESSQIPPFPFLFSLSLVSALSNKPVIRTCNNTPETSLREPSDIQSSPSKHSQSRIIITYEHPHLPHQIIAP